MKLQQLRFLSAIAKHNLNISAAAERLYTSQPGVSKQVKLLEEELGVKLFNRNGKHLTSITPVGRQVIEKASLILAESANIKAIANEFRDDNAGMLTLATTHTQARYVLPDVINRFVREFPDVKLNLIQGTPEKISEMAVSGEADFAIATEAITTHSELILMPAYKWNRAVVVPKSHDLAFAKRISLAALAQYPIVTYVKGLTGRGVMDSAFEAEGLIPDLVFTATDADVIKTYVRSRLGIGLIARQAFEQKVDNDLVAVDVGHLFQDSITRVGFRRGTYMRRYMARFLELFAPHFDRDTVYEAEQCGKMTEIEALFENVVLPVK